MKKCLLSSNSQQKHYSDLYHFFKDNLFHLIYCWRIKDKGTIATSNLDNFPLSELKKGKETHKGFLAITPKPHINTFFVKTK